MLAVGAGLRVRSALKRHVPRWPESIDETVSALHATDALVTELRRCGFAVLFGRASDNGVLSLTAGKRTGQHLVVVRSVEWPAHDGGAEAVLGCVHMLERAEACRSFGFDRPSLHRMLLVTFRTRFGAADPAGDWIEEFFDRVPRAPAPSDAPARAELTRFARGRRPLRCQFQVAEVLGPREYTRHRIGVLVW